MSVDCIYLRLRPLRPLTGFPMYTASNKTWSRRQTQIHGSLSFRNSSSSFSLLQVFCKKCSPGFGFMAHFMKSPASFLFQCNMRKYSELNYSSLRRELRKREFQPRRVDLVLNFRNETFLYPK